MSIKIRFEDIDEGLGECLATLLAKRAGIEFAGYHRHHPLREEHEIHVKLASPDVPWKSQWNASLDELQEAIDSIGLVSISDWRGEILFRHSHPEIANTFRRCLLSELHVLALTKFNVKRNTTTLCNDILVRRLSQIPIRSHEGIPTTDSQVTIALDSRLPSIEDQIKLKFPNLIYTKTITTQDLDVEGGEIVTLVTNERGERINSPTHHYPIVLLYPGESISLRGVSSRGRGDQHSRFSPIGWFKYNYEPGSPFAEMDLSDIHMQIEMVGQLKFEEVVHETKKEVVKTISALKLSNGD